MSKSTSQDNRIHALQQKHAELEAKLQQLDKLPAVDAEQVAVLKKSKLTIKDEIRRLSHPETAALNTV